MEPPPTASQGRRPWTRWRACAVITAAIPILIGTADLLAWSSGALDLLRLRPGTSLMVPLTAACTILLGIGVLLAQRRDAWSLAAPVLGTVGAVTGLAVLTEYAAGGQGPLDRLLFPDQVTAVLPDSLGRPSAWTALALVCLGAAVAMLRTHRRGSWTASNAFLVVAAVVTEIVLVAHVFDATQLLTLGQTRAMSLLTAVAFASLVLSVGLARPDREPLRSVLVRADRGTAFWVLPAGLLLPLGLGAVVRGLMAVGAELVTAVIVASVLAGVLVAGLVGWLAVSRQEARETLALRRRLADEERLAASMLELAPGGMALCTPDGVVVRANRAFADLLGRSVDEVLGLRVADFTEPSDLAAEVPLIEHVMAGESDSYRLDKRYLRPDGSCVWCDLGVTVIRAPDGSVRYGIAMATDIEQRRREHLRLRDAARHDALTGVGNRVALEERLTQVDREPGRSVALLFVDVDDFKEVNDRHGHPAGDALLTEVGTRLAGCVRDGDLVARIGGDEFVVVAELVAPGDVLPLLSRVRDTLDGDLDWGQARIAVQASVGAALVDERGSRDAFLRADEEMYADKRRRTQS